MSSKVLRMYLCVVVAAIFGTAVGFARAAVYDVDYDPAFDGTTRIQIGDGCLLTNGTFSSTGACTLDLISADVFDTSSPLLHYTSGFQSNIGTQVVISGNELTQFSTPNLDPFLSCGVECSGFLFFTFGNAFLDTVTGAQLSDGYILVRVNGVPEPGSLALILGAVAAAWLARRRKTAA